MVRLLSPERNVHKFYVTTPIYYVNDVPHIGHAYTTVAADALARHHRLLGHKVFFLTGTDEHGQKVEKTAKETGETPIQLADRVVKRFQDLWKRLDISHDDFIRTTEPRHKAFVQKLWQRVRDRGYIYLGEYEDWYCVPDETFIPETQLVDGKCPQCGRPVEKLKEASYFFKLSAFQQPLLEWLRKNPTAVRPESRYNEIVSFIAGGLRDLSLSRTSFSWGIPVPDDPKHVIYVWFDALANYISALGGDESEAFRTLWPADVHLVGKDIVRFHAVYWPAFLMAAGLEPARQVFAHGWWTVEGQKMSKSLRNAVDPNLLIDEYGSDAVRYFLLREVPFGTDGDFSHKALIQRINSELANDLGNLLSRTVGMLDRYLGGKVPPACPGGEIERFAAAAWASFRADMEILAFHSALDNVWSLVRELNGFVDRSAPWALHKQGETAKLETILYTALEGLRHCGRMLAPIMPRTAEAIHATLGGIRIEPTLTWGGLPSGLTLCKPEALFPRIETEKKLQAVSQRAQVALGGHAMAGEATGAKAQTKVEHPVEEPIGYDDFAKVVLKVGRVVQAERIPKSDKLLKLLVDLGEEKPRQIVAGIAKHYSPEALVGRLVTIVANLKPAKLMGILSQGMILAASDENGLRLVQPDAEIVPGARVK